MTASVHELLGRRVSFGGIRLGEVTDVLLDQSGAVPIGLEVDCTDGRERFLALAACSLVDGQVIPASPLALLESGVLDYYRARGVSTKRGLRAGP